MFASLAMSISLSMQPPVAPPAKQSCTDLRPSIQAIASALRTKYVSAREGAGAAARLQLATKQTEFSKVCGDWFDKARLLTRVTRQGLNDLHLRVAYGEPDSTDIPAEPTADALSDNLGIQDVSRLPGGIGYLRISGWAPLTWVEPRLKNAFALLQGASAIIIDVRSNPGGDGGTVAMVVRTFLPEGSPMTLKTFDREGRPAPADPTKEPDWPRFASTIPVAILTNRESASGSEALAFALKEEGRAITVGTRTAGAAHSVRSAVPLPGGFSLYLPEYRLEGRLSHTDWEGTGVPPDIEASDSDAEELAWEALRQKLAGQSSSGLGVSK